MNRKDRNLRDLLTAKEKELEKTKAQHAAHVEALQRTIEDIRAQHVEETSRLRQTLEVFQHSLDEKHKAFERFTEMWNE